MISVVEIPSSKRCRTQPVGHVSQEIRLFGLEALRCRDVRQKIHLQDVESDPLTLSSSAQLPSVSAANKVEGGILVLHRESLLNARSQHLEHGGIVWIKTDMIKNVSVRDDAQSSEYDDNWDRHLGSRELDVYDCSTLRWSGRSRLAVLSKLTVAAPELLGYIRTSVSVGMRPPFSILLTIVE